MSLLRLPALALVRPNAAASAKQNVKFNARIVAATDDAGIASDTFELDIYDIIDPAGETWYGCNFVSAKDVRAKLKAAGAVSKIVVRINSVGGDVFDGTAIYNILKDHPARVEIHVDGICASIASIIAMAGDTITMGNGTWMMIHCPYSQFMVDARSEDLRKAADTLDKMRDSMASVYAERTGIKAEECIVLMQEETWMTAEEALEKGFCTAINSVPLDTTPDQESEVDSEQVEAMVAELTRSYARIPAGALQAMNTATKTYAIAAMAAASAARSVAEGDEDELDKAKKAKKQAEDDLKKAEEDKKALSDKVIELEKEMKEMKKAADDAKAAAAAPPDKDPEEEESSAGGGDDKAKALAESAALARLGIKARALTGKATLGEAEKELDKLVARADRVDLMEARMAHIRKERHLAKVSELIAQGVVLPSRKAYLTEGLAEAKDDKAIVAAVDECESRLSGWLSATGGEKIGPVATTEHKQPSVPQLMTAEGKGIITEEERRIAKLTGGLTEEQLQAAADIRAQRFGNSSAA